MSAPLALQADGNVCPTGIAGGRESSLDWHRVRRSMDGLWSITGRSLFVSGTAVVMAALVGVPLGVWLGSTRFRGDRFVRIAVHAGMAMPPVVVGLALYVLFSRSGPFAFAGWLYAVPLMIVAQALLAVPFVVAITSGAVAAVPSELPLQLRGLGASAWQTRWAVLREARSGVLVAIAAAFGRSLSEVGAVLLVGGNIAGHTRVLTTAIVLETSRGQFGFALALGSILVSLALLLNAVVLGFEQRTS